MSIGIEADALKAETGLRIAAPPQLVDDAEEERAQLPFHQPLIGTDSVEDEAACKWFHEEKRGAAGRQIDLGDAESVRVICVEAAMGDSPERLSLNIHQSMDVIRDWCLEFPRHCSSSPSMDYAAVIVLYDRV
ncbi:hypothetical protein GCM10009689_34030 [Brevibacterium antiquum]